MARSTATAAAPGSRCYHCNLTPEVTVSSEALTIRVCAVHADHYTRRADLTVTTDAEARLAVCDCGRVIGHNGNAAHRCTAEEA